MPIPRIHRQRGSRTRFGHGAVLRRDLAMVQCCALDAGTAARYRGSQTQGPMRQRCLPSTYMYRKREVSKNRSFFSGWRLGSVSRQPSTLLRSQPKPRLAAPHLPCLKALDAPIARSEHEQAMPAVAEMHRCPSRTAAVRNNSKHGRKERKQPGRAWPPLAAGDRDVTQSATGRPVDEASCRPPRDPGNPTDWQPLRVRV
jgi:hypothetical protein